MGKKDDGYSSKLTSQDYFKLSWPPLKRLELLNGVLTEEAAPLAIHQVASANLVTILYEYFRTIDPRGEIFIGLLDVYLNDYNVVQPDILFISSEQRQIIKDYINGAPTLAVEIINPTTRVRDRIYKHRLYRESGVQHYWIVDPEFKTLECFALDTEKYYIAVVGAEDEVLKHPDFAGLTLPLEEVWKI